MTTDPVPSALVAAAWILCLDTVVPPLYVLLARRVNRYWKSFPFWLLVVLSMKLARATLPPLTPSRSDVVVSYCAWLPLNEIVDTVPAAPLLVITPPPPAMVPIEIALALR